MGRKPRIQFEGGVYHVVQRGNNKEYIFKKDDVKKQLLNIIIESKEIMKFEIYGFVIMDNHYHIVIRNHEVPISEIMHRIDLKFSKYYNFTYNKSGHVFQDRYKGILVKDDKYLLSLIRYVHQNPVKARMCKKVTNYYWSSDSYYRKNIQGKIVDIDFVLCMFSENRNNALVEYRKFMDSTLLEESADFEDVSIIGELKPTSIDIPLIKTERKTLDELLYEVSGDDGIFDEIKRGSRKRELTHYKMLYIEKAIHSNFKMKDIGLNIGISQVAVHKLNNLQ